MISDCFGIIMVDFDLETFVNAPSMEQLDKCRKCDLINVAAHYQIAFMMQQLKREIKSAFRSRGGFSWCRCSGTVGS